MGYAGNMEPSYLIPSVVATHIDKVAGVNQDHFSTNEMDYFIGEEAQKRGRTHDLRYLLKAGQVSDWDGIEKFWHKSIHEYIRCEPDNHRFILTEPPMNTPENREQMAEIMFETFNVKGLFIGVQATLALYAQIAGPNSSVDI
jgi:actin-related protein 3